MPTEEKKQIKTSTGILIILAAAVIIGGGAIGYFYAKAPTSWDYMGNRTTVHKSSNTNTSNANSATASWKTYYNNTYGYLIKYPVTLDGSETIISNTSDDSSFTIRPKAWQDNYFNIEVSKDTIENLVNKKKQSSGLTNFRQSDIKIGSAEATQLLYDIIGSNGSSGIKDEKIVFLKDGDVTLVFTGGPVKGDIGNLESNPSQAIWDQILSTFHFTQ